MASEVAITKEEWEAMKAAERRQAQPRRRRLRRLHRRPHRHRPQRRLRPANLHHLPRIRRRPRRRRRGRPQRTPRRTPHVGNRHEIRDTLSGPGPLRIVPGDRRLHEPQRLHKINRQADGSYEFVYYVVFGRKLSATAYYSLAAAASLAITAGTLILWRNWRTARMPRPN